MWKAVIVKIGDVDASERFEVYYDVYRDEDKLYENLMTSNTSKESIEMDIKLKLESLKQVQKEQQILRIGDEIFI